jgi:succinate dehydrogenase/fumarate reductase cytochrome b subunit
MASDDDYDDAPRSSGAKGPLDNMFANTNIVILILFALCCGIIALVLALVCYFTAKDPKAKSNAMLIIAIDVVLFIVGIVIQLAGLGAGLMGAGK